MKFSLLNLLIFSFSLAAQAEQVTIATKHSTMVLEVENGKQPQYVYFGQKLSDFDLTNLQAPRNGRMNAYPAYGMDCPAEAAIAVTHADGNMSTELFVTGMEKQDGILRIILKDPVYPTTVALCYKAYEDEDMIETWTEITNGEAKPVTLTQFASICLPIRRGNVWLSHFYGSWANEAQLVEEPILAGEKVIKIKDFKLLKQQELKDGKWVESPIEMPLNATSNVLQYFTEGGLKVSVRPSGTEPKIKFYFEIPVKSGKPFTGADYERCTAEAEARVPAIKASLGL